MKNKLTFSNVDLTSEEKEYIKTEKQVSNLIIQMIDRRIDLKLSQRDFAKACGIKQPMIARIEKFDSTPRIDTLIKMCNALGLRIVIEKDDSKEKEINNDDVIIFNNKEIHQKSYELNEEQEILEVEKRKSAKK